MTGEALRAAGIPLGPVTELRVLMAEAAVEWIKANTTLEVEELAALPAGAKLFLVKFVDIMSMTPGVASESIEGLNHSFDTAGKNILVWQVAQELLGGYLKSQVRTYPAKRKW